MDKSLSRTRPDAEGNIIFQNFTNINAMHQGLEMDFTAKITKQLSMTGMVSLGDWNWISDGSGQAIDQDGNILADTTIYADGLKVGNSAQTTFAAGLKFKADKKTSFTLDWNYAGKNYADFNIDSVTSPGSAQPWEMPEFNLFDLGASHKFKFADLDAQLSGNLHNIFNTEYISDARGFSVNEAIVYYGAGRTFNLALKVKF
jgi:outer membrane receptor protein involved in Fe transport